MTADSDTREGGKDVTASIDDLEQQILALIDGAELDYVTTDVLAINLNLPLEDVLPAVENLEQRGELKSEPVVYERVR